MYESSDGIDIDFACFNVELEVAFVCAFVAYL
jgi:hypothetical protein